MDVKNNDLAHRWVFILGAGVSASCGIPVAKDIFREAMLRLRDRDRAKAALIHRLLRYLYANFDERTRNYPNIEDFLNLLEMARQFNGEEFIESSLWPISKLTKVYETTLQAVTDFLWDSMQLKEKHSAIREFTNYNLNEDDVVITFNWDTTIERAVWHDPRGLDIEYRYSNRRGTRSICLLKPHGSIDWFRRSNLPPGTPKKDLFDVRGSVCAYKYFSLAKNPKLKECKPLIVPPLSAKEFGDSLWAETWGDVYRALSRATKLIILGYSLPREDQFARLVLRRALRNNIIQSELREKLPLSVTVVNPDEGVEGTFSRLIGRKVKKFSFRQSYFEDYVAGLQED